MSEISENAKVKAELHGDFSNGPYWNAVAFQFMYAPAFQFQGLPGTKKYRYDLKDANGNIHSFETSAATASLSPVWDDIPEGIVNLTVTALADDGGDYALAGARTFFRLAPFTDDLPAAVRSYRESAALAFSYAVDQSYIRHWLTDGTPDPSYERYVYPSKMIASIIDAMIHYAAICPDRSDEALTIAQNAADYLISITPGAGSPIEGLPPTYYINFRPDPEKQNNLSAGNRLNTVMMLYPTRVGSAYLALEKATGNKKYFDAALKIAEYYKNTVEENGSWALVRSTETGEKLTDNFCFPLSQITPFFVAMYERTGEKVWKDIADGTVSYVERNVLPLYNWEGQFEDSPISTSYTNLSHYGATALIRHYLKFFPNDENHMRIADELMRFVEDQFVIWKKPSPWNRSGYNTDKWHTPCGLEQYNWHVPIDASTADIMKTFLAMYKAGRGDTYLAKAKALADSITRVQHENGFIPTHWMNDAFRAGKNTWINCLFSSAGAMAEIASFLD